MKYDEIKPKPTMYKGVQFRSRLEAKWAAFFDYFNWQWQYEPFDLNGWSPDFLLKLPYGNLTNIDNVLVEIKPEALIDIPLYVKMYEAVGNLPYSMLLLNENPIEWFANIMPSFTGRMPLTISNVSFPYKGKKYREFSVCHICGMVGDETQFSIIPFDNPEHGEKHWYFVDEKTIENVWKNVSNKVMFYKP